MDATREDVSDWINGTAMIPVGSPDWCVLAVREIMSRPAPDKLALAVEALEFYAQPVWSISGNFNEPSPHSEYRPDCGDTARKALAAIKAST